MKGETWRKWEQGGGGRERRMMGLGREGWGLREGGGYGGVGGLVAAAWANPRGDERLYSVHVVQRDPFPVPAT